VFHDKVNDAATNNVELVSELAIITAMTTSTHVHTSTTNTQADEIVANTEVNDEIDDEAQGKKKMNN